MSDITASSSRSGNNPQENDCSQFDYNWIRFSDLLAIMIEEEAWLAGVTA